MDIGVVDREFPYRSRRPLLTLVLAWACVAAALYWATTDRGPIRGRDGSVTTGASSAAFFRWSVAGLGGALAVLVTRWSWIDLRHCRRIAVTSRGALLPRVKWFWVPVEEFVPYEDMSDFRATLVRHVMVKEGAMTRLTLRGPRRRYAIARDDLPPGAFDEVCRLLTERAEAARRGRG